MYKLIDNNLELYPNPIPTALGIITNPTREILISEGYKPIIDNKPYYNLDTQYLEFTSYTEDDTNIYTNYIVKDKQIEQEETIEEKIARLEQELAELKTLIQ